MTLGKTRVLPQMRADFGGFYNHHGAKLFLAEVAHEQAQAAVDRFIADLKLDEIFKFQAGHHFETPS